MIAESEAVFRRGELSPAKRALLEKRLRGERLPQSDAPLISRRQDHSGTAPLSFAQERLWFAQQLAPASPLYNVSMAVRLEGPLDKKALERALDEIVARHETLRTRFVIVEGEPRQVVDPPNGVTLRRIDLPDTGAEASRAAIQRLFREEASRPFDLSADPMLRAVLAEVGSGERVLLLTTHHIVSDGWSMGLLLRELAGFCEAFASGRTPEFAALPIQYADYAIWQRNWMRGEVLQGQLDWWKQHLAGAPDTLELPADRPRPPVQSFRGRWHWKTLPMGLSEALRDFSRREGATLFMTLMAAFQSLLHRYTGRKDFLIGSPVAGRNERETEALIGFFINTLVWRADFSSEPDFREVLHRVREATLGAMAHQDLPFEALVEALRPGRSPSRAPLVQVMFVFQNVPRPAVQWPGLNVTPISEEDVDTGTAKFDLTLQAQESDAGLRLAVEYSTDLFEAATIERMLGHFQTLLESIVANPARSVATLPMLKAPERQQLLVGWNETHAEYPRDKTIPELFAEQVARRGEEVAVVFEGRKLSYRELDERADQLAQVLRRHGVGPDVLVAVCMERSAELIVALLGILKAGGAYVALEPTLPEERMAIILEESQSPVLLTEDKLRKQFAAGFSKLKLLSLGKDGEIPSESALEANRQSCAPGPLDLAYVSFTSGSTGRPKGVCVPHRAVVRLLFNTDYVALGPGDVIAQVSNCAFDASTFEIWGALLHGGRLVIFPRQTVLSPAEFARGLRDNGVTAMFVTTALFNQLSRDVPGIFGSLRHLLFGGEAVNPACVREVLAHGPPQRLLHVYGPTEATTFATWHEVRSVALDAATVPIGRPIANTEAYVLDSHRQPVPIGVPGELYLGGDGLARGYLNQPELTAEKFGPHPFSGEPGARLYRTGDWVRYLPDGSIEFLGRADLQIKLRGFRVELGEIESVISQHPGVQQCVMTVTEGDSADRRLVAYVVPKDARAPAPDELRNFLRTKLPDYMVPADFVFLPALPLNANGKVDRGALPAPDLAAREPGKEFVAPRDQTERQLAAIWEELLGARPVGARDNFFDLGGHSLLAVRLVTRIERTFGKALPVSAVLASPTLEQLAAAIREKKPAGIRTGSSIVEIQATGTKPPVFLVHGAGGGMFWGYTNLARQLGTDQPVYAFKSRGLDGEDEFRSVEEMAARYVADLRVFQPEGPYRLGGYCFGGNVAWEMARQLEAQGEQVAMLVLLNSAPTHSSQPRVSFTSAWLAKFLGNLGYLTAEMLRRPLNSQRRFMAWRVRAACRRIAHGLGLNRVAAGADSDELVDLSEYPPDQRRLWEAHIRALFAHRTQSYAGRVTLFRSRGFPLWCSFDPTYGWSEFSKGQLAVEIVPGAHEQILEEPHVEVLARELQQALAAAGEERTADYPRHECVHQLFEQQAARTPEAVAVECHGERLSYRELNRRANRIARHLRQLNVGPDVPVGICLERSPAMAAGVLGILKAGGAYVPLDPAYPPERLRLMIENARVPVLLTERAMFDRLELPSRLKRVCVEDLAPEEPAGAAEENLSPGSLTPEHLAYVIHTSGSTGTPKGVAMPHRPLVNLISWQVRDSKAGPGTRTLQFASLSFDVSFQEMFATWCSGGTLVLIDEETRRDPAALLDFIERQQIERLFLPFVALQHLAEAAAERASAPSRLREVITAGEQLQITPQIAELFERLPDCTLHNHYGPSEAHVVTAYTLSGPPGEWPALPPIGKPISNTQVHLLDKDGRPVPEGSEGQIHIGGDCLARGYLHRPDLTAEKFIGFQSNGFSGRLYKTGDLGRLRPDGNIEFLGRIDHQVKIRGFRIELGEIEAALRRHPTVRETVVVAREDRPGNKRLVAYCVPRNGEMATRDELRRFLAEKLPEYMAPSAFVTLNALPLTPNGKVDRKRLPAPEESKPDREQIAPRDDTELELARIWEAVLDVRPIGVRDNFFDAGGHSLLAARVAARIEKSFGQKLSVADIFRGPTVEEQAKLLRGGMEVPGSSIVKVQPRGSKPPLFLVHGAGGGMFWGYANLARHLGEDQPLFAFSSTEEGEEQGTVEEMARQYVADLRVFQPHGPYCLGGYCFGGNIAYEMARQLEAMGEQVALLALFNCRPPNSSYTELRITRRFCSRFLKNVWYWADYVLQLDRERRREWLQWKARTLAKKCGRFLRQFRAAQPSIHVDEWVDIAAQPAERHELWAAHIRAYLDHHTRAYGGRVTLFRTFGHPLLCSFEDDCGWRGFARGGVEVRVVPGAHESILDEPHVQALAKELKRDLDAAQAAANSGDASPAELLSPLRPNAAPAPSSRAANFAQRCRNRGAFLLLAVLLLAVFPALVRARVRLASRAKTQPPSMLQAASEETFTSRERPRDSRQPLPANGFLVTKLIDAQVAKTPDATAVMNGGAAVTFRQLSGCAARLARHMKSLGVAPGSFVGIYCDRSWQAVAAMLGVLKAGAAYVPIEPEGPQERLALILEDAQPALLLTQERHAPMLERLVTSRAGLCPHLLCVDAAMQKSAEPAVRNALIDPEPGSPAYLIYTSGSTGRPKGVLVPHSALANHSTAMAKVFGLSRGDRVLQFASLSFDVAAEELFPTLLSGATVVLRSSDCTAAVERFFELVERENITVLNLPAAWWHEIVDALDRGKARLPESVRLVITGNESVSPEKLRRWQRIVGSRVRWLNAYGPTEATITATVFEPDLTKPLPDTRAVPIGRPIANVQAHVLDEHLRPVRNGEAGELHLGGAGVASGYLNRPELTAAKFISDPFRADSAARLYKTGDRVGALPDGNLEFLGRIDDQVKIRGYRIEPGEVEAALQRHPAIAQAAVVARRSGLDAVSLLACVVPAAGAGISSDQLRAFLRQQLPEPWVPARFVELAELPLTTSGKVDRRALLAMNDDAGERNPGFDPPRDDLERQLAALWEEVLEVNPVGVRHHFFDSGGNSLLAARLVARIDESFGRRLPIGSLLQAPTIEAQAALLRDGSRAAESSRSSLVEIQPRGDRPPLFLVHGVGGGMFWGYANLARQLGASQPVYAFKSRGLDGLEEFPTVEEMASHYVADLRAFQPAGPYHLGGYCFGGNVAYEMACQLEAAGQRVATLALFNCWPSNSSYEHPRLTPAFCVKFLGNLRYWAGYTFNLPHDQRRDVIRWKARAVKRKCLRLWERFRGESPTFDSEEWSDLAGQPLEHRALWSAHMRAVLEHMPRRFGGHVSVFRIRGHQFYCSFDDAYGWRELARSVSVHIVEGAHESILAEPHVRALGAVLKAHLDRAQAKEPV